MKKLAALLLMCLTLVAMAAADSYTFLDKTDDVSTRYFASSPHMVGVCDNSHSYTYGMIADLFQMVKQHDDGTKEIIPAFCADLGQSLKSSGYGKLELEDSYLSLYAGYIRNILDKGYWPGRSMEDLGNRAGLTESDGTLTEAEALTATQAAIWSYSNGTTAAEAEARGSKLWVDPNYCYLCTHTRNNNVVYTGVVQDELKITGVDDEAYGYWDHGPHMNTVAKTKTRIFKVYNYLMSLEPMNAVQDVTWTFEGEYYILSEIWQADNADGSNERPNVNSGWWDDFWDWWLGLGGNTPQGSGQYYYRVLTRFKLDGAQQGLEQLTLKAALVIDGEEIESQSFNMMNAADVAKLKQDTEGYYSVGFSYPLTSAEFDKDATIVLSLSGKQTMSEVPYLYLCTDAEGRAHSQTLVGVEDRVVTLNDQATLKVEDAKLSLNGQKYRHGQATGVEYSFDLFESNAQGEKGQLIQTVTNDAQGKFSFADISYTDKKTRYYIVAEHLPAGLTNAQKADYDQGWYHIKAEVTGNDALVVTPTITKHAAPGKASTAVVQGLNFDNKPTTTFTVTKKWDTLAADNSLVPASVGVTLYENGTPYGEEITLSASNAWTHTWTGLNADSAWTVVETTGADDFISTVNDVDGGAEIVNTSRKGSVRVEKKWDLMPYQPQPESVTVILLKNGKEDRRATLPNENGTWWCQWNDLDRDAIWTVAEETPSGMKMEIEPAEDAAGNGRDYAFVITNRTDIRYADYSVRKIWNLNPYQTQPESVRVALYYSVGENGHKNRYGEPVVLNEANGWAYTWEQLDSGYVWTVEETDLPEDMESVVTFDEGSRTFTLTNGTVARYAAYSVQKVWNLNAYQSKPASVSVALYKRVGEDGEKTQHGEPVELNEANGWAYTWEQLDSGYIWSVEEINLPAGMRCDVTYDDATRTFTMTNSTVVRLTDVRVVKRWDVRDHNERVRPVYVALYCSLGGHAWQYGDAVLLSAENDWSHTWHGLDAGYTWSVQEVDVPEDMTAEVTYDAANRCFVITNCLDEMTDVSVRKVWEVRRSKIPASVDVALYKDGVLYDTVTLSRENKWAHTWEDVSANHTWTVEELNVPEGMVSLVEQDGFAFVITNMMDVNVPDTGDGSTPALWTALCLLCGTAMLLLKRRARV